MALADDCVWYLKLDDNSSPESDSVGSNDATVNGATFTASGKINGGYTFDGTNDNLTVAHNVALTISGDYSISFWMKATGSGVEEVINKAKSDNSEGFRLIYRPDVGNDVMQLVQRGSTDHNQTYSTGTNLSDGSWHLIIVTFDWSTGQGTVYVDNDAGTSNTAGSTFVADDETTLMIGNYSSNYFTGTLDEFGLFNKILTSQDRSDIYNSGTGLQYPFAAADSLTITAPNGAESWVEGDVENITWTDTGSIANVKLELSTNNGGSYEDIVASTTNDGTYEWTLPAKDSSQCLVRISDVLDSGVNDVSDAVFTISLAPEPPDADRGGNTKGDKELQNRWPVTSGLTAGTTRQKGRQSNLVPKMGSNVPRRLKKGL